jgi:cytochrome-b5 reductase
LAEIEPISHNTSIFRFELPKDHIAGLPVASCIFFKHLGENGKNIIRPYTPVSESDVSYVVRV